MYVKVLCRETWLAVGLAIQPVVAVAVSHNNFVAALLPAAK